MNTAPSSQIASLPALSKAELLSVWASNFSNAPPSSLRRDPMVPFWHTGSKNGSRGPGNRSAEEAARYCQVH